MDAILKSDHVRKTIQDPIVADWLLRKFEGKKRAGVPDLAELERFLFDNVTIRRLLDHGESNSLAKLFRTLSPECFRDATDLLLDRWPGWQDTVACWSAPVIAEMAPARAVDLFRAYVGRQSIWNDFNKTAGVCRAAHLIRSDAGRVLAKQLIEQMADGDNELTRGFGISQSVHLAWTHELAVLESLLIDLVTSPDKVTLAEKALGNIYHVFTDGMPFFEHVLDLKQGNTQQSFTSLAPSFDTGAPLQELDRLVTGTEEISIGEAFVFLVERCRKRDYRPREVVSAFMMNREESVQSKLKPLLGRFFLGIGAASWLRCEHGYSGLTIEECVHATASDVRLLPGYDGLLARMREFPTDHVVRSISEQLPEAQNHFGAIHLVRMMGDLGHDAFIPLLINCLDEGQRDFVLEAAGDALSRFGHLAERALLESLEQLDTIQRVSRLGVLADVGGESTVPRLVRCFPEMRSELLEIWCDAASAMPDPRLLHVLEPELRRMQPLIDDTYLLISTLLDKNPEPLAAVRERVNDRKGREKERQLAPRPQGPVTKTLRMELKCRKCGDLNVYEVRSVFIAPEAPQDRPYVADELTCHSCGTFDSLEVSGTGYLALTAELIRVASAKKAGGSVDSALRLVTGELADGRLVSVGQAIEHYAEALREKPDSPVNFLSLGNCYAGVGRRRQAEACYRECLHVDPSSAEAAYALAGILDSAGKRAEAFRVLDRALQHKKRWRFYRLTDTTPQEFAEAFAELYNAVSSSRREASRTMLHPRFLATPEKVDTQEKISPNAPCHCGSGKKYKKCCGRVAT